MMSGKRVQIAAWVVGAAMGGVAAGQTVPAEGGWRGWLDSPGGELPFRLGISRAEGGWRAWLINGAERSEAPRVVLEGEKLILDIQHYDATIEALVSDAGRRLDGTWTLRRGRDKWTKMPFHAVAGEFPQIATSDVPASADDALRIAGRWRVKFEKSDAPAVGIFETQPDGTITGTFLTTGGDYRYLSGVFAGGRLRLAAFDGRFALLFDAKLMDDGTLAGEFWSGDSWHEMWTAVRDDEARLPDGIVRPANPKTVDLATLVYKDLDGNERSLKDVAGLAKLLIVDIFGTWCPNCHDAGKYLEQVQQQFGAEGVAVVGLAFEVTGDFARDATQVKRFARRHSISYPLLIAGEFRKDDPAGKVPLVEKIEAYPTTILVDAGGTVRAVHTGFAGPATGADYRRQSTEFEAAIREILRGRDAIP